MDSRLRGSRLAGHTGGWASLKSQGAQRVLGCSPSREQCSRPPQFRPGKQSFIGKTRPSSLPSCSNLLVARIIAILVLFGFKKADLRVCNSQLNKNVEVDPEMWHPYAAFRIELQTHAWPQLSSPVNRTALAAGRLGDTGRHLHSVCSFISKSRPAATFK